MRKTIVGMAIWMATFTLHAWAQNTFPAIGNVGIGTTTPEAPLDLLGYLHLNSSTVPSFTQQGLYLDWNALTGTTGESDFITNQGYGQGGFAFMNTPLSGTPVTPLMFITGAGMVGIGTANPEASLTILSSGQNAVSLGRNENTTRDINLFDISGMNNYGIRFNGITQGAYRASILVNGVESLAVVQSGNVGIGTTAPGAKLEVDGSVKLTSGSGASLTFADGTVQSTAYTGVTCGGDYAESVDVTGNRTQYEPGDVLVLDTENAGRVLKSAEAYSTAVSGIYSTKPGVVGRRQTSDPKTAKTEVPMAMVGVVPTKVSAENGAIKVGDLLVSSSTSGYAMKGTDRGRMLGAVIGKAMGNLNAGMGVVEVLVTLQ